MNESEVSSTTAVETPDTPDTTDADAPVSIGNIPLTPTDLYPAEAIQRSKKGSKGTETYTLVHVKIPLDKITELLTKKLNEAGNQVFESWLVREGIKPACNEATSEAWKINDAGEVNFDVEKYVTTFWDFFVPSDRRKGGGVSIKDLTERLRAVTPLFTAAIEENNEAEQAYIHALEQSSRNRTPTPNRSDFITDEVQNKVRQLLLEVTELNAQIEKKSRPGTSRKGTGRPPGSKNKTKVAPVAVEA